MGQCSRAAVGGKLTPRHGYRRVFIYPKTSWTVMLSGSTRRFTLPPNSQRSISHPVTETLHWGKLVFEPTCKTRSG